MDSKKQKNILLGPIGTAGGVFPFIGLGVALKSRGNNVIIIANEYFKTVIEQAGINFIELGKKEDYYSTIQNPNLWDPSKGLETLAKYMLLPQIRPLYKIISNFDPNNTIIATSGLNFGARIAHEKLKYPLATINTNPAMLWSAYQTPEFNINYTWPALLPRIFKKIFSNLVELLLHDKIFKSEINTFLKELNLKPAKYIFRDWMHSPQCIISLFPQWFCPPQPDWPKQVKLTNFIFFDKKIDNELLSDVDNFFNTGEAPIIFTPGTGMIYGKEFFKAAIEACILLNKRGILLTENSSQIPTNLPKQIIYFKHIPFGKYLKKSSAIVHHGGIGTTARAISAGIPQLITPFSLDQPDNAMRIKRLGFGLFLKPKEINGKNMADKLNYLLTSGQVKNKCNEFSNKLQQNDGLEDACSIIENLI